MRISNVCKCLMSVWRLGLLYLVFVGACWPMKVVRIRLGLRNHIASRSAAEKYPNKRHSHAQYAWAKQRH